MKKILILIPSGNIGGVEIASYNLVDIFLDGGYDVKIVKVVKNKNEVLKRENEEVLMDEYTGKNIIKKIFRLVELIKKLKKLKKLFKPDIIVSNGDFCNTLAGIVFFREKKIGTVHSIKSIEIQNQGLYGKFCLFGIRYLYHKFSRIVCISEGVKQDLLENFKNIPAERIEVIYNCHDLKKIKILSKEEIIIENEKKIFEDDVILSIGRIVKTKAPWHLIKAFSLIYKKYPKVKLVFIGPIDIEVEDILKNLITKFKMEDVVLFLGKKNNPYNYLRSAKMLAMTSYFEGLPNVIVEALAVNTPVISTDSSLGIWETIGEQKFKNKNFEKDGVAFFKNGIIVKKIENNFKNLEVENLMNISEEEKKFAIYLERMLLNYSYKNMENSKILDEFSFKSISQQYLQLLLNLN